MKAALFAVILVAFPALALAECAWVLWEDTSSQDKTSTEPVRAYNVKQDCDRALNEALASFKGAPNVIGMDTKYQEAYVKRGNSTIAYRYVCLPDTVDPREAKGK